MNSSAVIRSKLILFGLLFAVAGQGLAQSKADLQRQRDAIAAQLANTERLLGQARENRSNAVSELQLVDQVIAQREALIRQYRQALRQNEREMNGTDSEIRSLEGHIAALRDEYARMVQQAYRMKLAENPMLYLFAAESFSQAVLRFQLLQSYAELRKAQVAEIQSNQEDLTAKRSTLEAERRTTQQLLDGLAVEREQLNADRAERERIVQSLKSEEERLRREQRQAAAERDRLNAEIRRLIEAELAAERASSAGEYALTPAGKIVSEAFERNKSTLPWPVMRGVMTGRFGRQNHPTLPGITIDNNGIDITTDAGAAATAIFDGRVTSVFDIPGSGATIIVSHGAYRTVYSNLTSVTVAKGQEITRGSTLGKVRTVGGSSVLHFEVWKIQGNEKSPVDPAAWLVRS